MTRHMWILSAIGLCGLVAASCGGLTSGADPIGERGTLGRGALAVDPRTETVFVLGERHVPDPRRAGGERIEVTGLFAATADRDEASLVAAVPLQGDAVDVKIFFPPEGVLVAWQRDAACGLTLLDPRTLAAKRSLKGEALSAPRASPSGRYILSQASDLRSCSLEVLDGTTLERVVLPCDGAWVEATWLNGSDELLAIVHDLPRSSVRRAHIRRWSFAERAETAALAVTPPRLDVVVDDVQPDLADARVLVTVDAVDRRAAFGVQRPSAGPAAPPQHELLVVDLRSGAVRRHLDARGPAGFTSDGQTIVAYRGGEGLLFDDLLAADGDLIDRPRDPELLLIAAQSGDEVARALPLRGNPRFAVPARSGLVIVSSAPSLRTDSRELLRYDLASGALTRIQGPGARLRRHVHRPRQDELWIVDGGLYRVELTDGRSEQLPCDGSFAGLGLLPRSELLVVGDAAGARVVFFDPRQRRVHRAVPLATP